ncbi:MAG TPA: DUF5654 family protein [Candidatus Thermoplasmatota archaeon]|nr:DUF5654 family protein [Candidatus Thermoplasmatota archaeon]
MPDIEKTREELLQEVAELRAKTLVLRREVVDKMSALATAAFGLVAALAWNNAIQAIFAQFYRPNDPNAVWPLLGYAFVVTIVAVLIILLIGRAAGRLKAQQAKVDEAKAATG